jgi:negative regulator of replication initiation
MTNDTQRGIGRGGNNNLRRMLQATLQKMTASTAAAIAQSQQQSQQQNPSSWPIKVNTARTLAENIQIVLDYLTVDARLVVNGHMRILTGELDIDADGYVEIGPDGDIQL